MSGFQFQEFASRLKEPKAEAIIVEIANQISSSQVAKPDLEDDQKRWIIVGICLHRIISPALRQYTPLVVNGLYNTLKQTDKIDQQTFAKHMKRYKPTNKELNYEAINNNSAIPKVKGTKDTRKYDYNVTNAVDLTKLFLITSMAHYTGFDDTCDSSALLNIVIYIDKFPLFVQTVAKKIRDDMRNPWAHCNFVEWDVIKYQKSFQLMNQLVRNLQLPLQDETDILAELTRWQTNGVQFLQGTTLGIELVQELKEETVALSKYILDLVSQTDVSFNDIHQALLSVEVSLKTTIDKVSNIEKENINLKSDMKDLSKRLDDSQKDRIESFEQTHEQIKLFQSDISESKVKVENIERSIDDIQLDAANTKSELQNTKEDIIYSRMKVKNLKKELQDARVDIDRNKSELRKTIDDVSVNRADINEMKKKYLSTFRPKEKIFFYPPDRISTFISREDELEQIQKEFYKTKSVHHVQVICGLGGIGKTTLAVEYSWSFQNFYPGGVFWMSAETNEALEDSLRRLAIDTYIDGKDAKEITMKTLNWMSYLQERWLLIIDNVDMMKIRGSMKELLLGAWKRNSKGHIIITSRRETNEAEEEFRIQSKDCITLDALSKSASVKFLTARSGIQNDIGDTLELLAEELGGLPLALEQAAAHIRSLKCTIKEYLDRFNRKRLKLLKSSRSSFDMSKERLAVQTTWQLNFDYIAKQSREDGLGDAAISVMEITAFLYPDEIPLNLLNTGFPEICDNDLLDILQDELGVKQVAEILVRFSLFQRCSDGALNVHRLVQEVIRESLTDSDRKAFVLECAIRMVNKALEETQSPRDALKEENIGRTSLHMWSKLALNANTLRTYLFDFTNVSEGHKDICINTETTKLLQASAIYHSLFQRQDEALACQDQMLSIIPAIGISESECKGLTSVKVPLLSKDRQIIQFSITMAVRREPLIGSGKEDTVTLLDPEKLREAGNDAFKLLKYQDAILYYSEAVTACQRTVDSRILTNRSLAYLRISDYENALRDADMSIQLDPKAHKAYCWKAYAIANLIRLGQLPSSWESAGLAAAAVAGYLNKKCLVEYKMKIEYPVIRYKIIEKESDLGSEMSSLMNMTYTTLLLRTGRYRITPVECAFITRSIQVIGIEEGVEIHSRIGIRFVRPVSSRFKFEDEINVYFENVAFPTQTGQIVLSDKVNAVFYRCRFSNGKKGCEEFPSCKGGEGCVNSNPLECRVLSVVNEKLSCPQPSGVVGHSGICAENGAKALLASCVLDRCGGGGTLSVHDGSKLLIKNSIVRNMRQMGVEARDEGLTIAENCTICDNQSHGVAIGPKGKGEVKNCTIENNNGEGIWCGGNLQTENNSRLAITSNAEGGSTCVIIGNLIYQNGMSGVSFEGGSYDISGNRIFENWLWGMMVKSRSTANICNNDIFENKCGGIRIGINFSSTILMDGNTFRDHTGPAVHTEIVPENLMPTLRQGDIMEMRTNFAMSDEITFYTTLPIITSRNALSNNNKGKQHPRKILSLVEACCFCWKKSTHFQKCAKCRKASYCSKKCQKVHWKRHKSICKLMEENFSVDILMSETKPLDEIMPNQPGHVTIIERNAPLPGLGEGKPPDRSSGKKFIVKIQSGTEYTRYDPNKEMRLYDQTQTLFIHFRNPDICNLVHECGVLAATTFTTKKIFCWASFKNNGKILCIHTENLPPFQTW